MRRLGVAIGVASLAVSLVVPTLRSAYAADEQVTLDVVVTDAKSQPITDLRPGDLELTDAGETRTVDAVRLQQDGGRIIGIFLDEFHVTPGDGAARTSVPILGVCSLGSRRRATPSRLSERGNQSHGWRRGV